MDAELKDHAPNPGLYGCDRELFAQVWSRVSPGPDGPLEVETGTADPPARGAERPRPEPPAEGLMCFQPSDGDAKTLQALALECLAGWNAYRLLSRRTRRRTQDLQGFARRKRHHAKRLSAACFLMTGVRYWPEDDLPAVRPADFFPALRERFIQEQRLAAQLKALGEAAGDQCLRELYLSLADETMELTHALRLLVEQET